jgi:uncharacterized membrane protein YphA (DoxX/SURF4 family)
VSFEIVFQICRWALTALFIVSAIAKLRSPETTLDDFTRIGVPTPELARYMIPAIEIAVAVALIISPPAGGISAFVLLVAFTTTLASIVKSGRTVGCACFGAISTEPVGRNQIYRNLVLMAAALIVALAS